jgi:DnaJ like chaperone protein
MAKTDYTWLLGAGLGFALGGPLGGILGAVLGSQVGRLTERFQGGAPARVRDTGYYTEGVHEGDLIVSFLVLSAAVTKADDKVLASEVRLLKEYLVRSFGMTRAAALMKLYKEILEKPVDLDAVLAQIREEADPGFKRTVFQVLFEIALSDDELAKSEAEMLDRIARGMGIPEAEIRGIESLYNVKAPHRDLDLLELPASATEEEIKSKYRELVKKYHPDKVSHLGVEFKELAERKFKEISAAYERIRKAKGF